MVEKGRPHRIAGGHNIQRERNKRFLKIQLRRGIKGIRGGKHHGGTNDPKDDLRSDEDSSGPLMYPA